MTDENDKVEETASADAADAALAEASAASEASADAPATEAEAGEKPKPARKPRAAKPKAEAAAADAPAAEAEAEEKPKPARKPRATKPKAEEALAQEAPAPKQPATRARRRGAEERAPAAAPVVRAQAKYVRSSARKARLVCDNIRGKSVEDARAILAHTPRAVARDWSKLLESAVANAEHNHELVGEDLVIKAVQADEGPTIKRFRPRAQGRATRIRKRTSHLTILLTPKN